MKKNQYLRVGVFLAFLVAVFMVQPVFSAVTPYISIEMNVYSVKTRQVQLYIQGPENTSQMLVSADEKFANANWEAYQTRKSWLLSYGTGTKIVYVKFKDKNNNVSSVYKDSIQLDTPKNMGVNFKINNETSSSTASRYVDLTFEYSDGVEDYIVSNDNNFTGMPFSPVVKSLSWILSPGSGTKTVWVQFRDANGALKTMSRKIIYNQPEISIGDGILVKGSASTIYYFGYDGELHPFLNSAIYHSWYQDFSSVRFFNDVKLSQYHIGQPVCVRAGTWLVQFSGLPRVYAVETGCKLRPMRSEVEAYLIYGKDWHKRILVLDQIYVTGYSIVTYDATDKDANIIDLDRDGVTSSTEKEYGSSDKNSDTDGDGLSDYEEIYYWFSDPKVADTDGDGTNDSAEIMNGFYPAGFTKLPPVPAKSYQYPAGSVFVNIYDGKLYYHHSNGKYYYLGKNISDKAFGNNKLQSRYVIQSPFVIGFTAETKTKLGKPEMEIVYPTQYVGKNVIKM